MIVFIVCICTFLVVLFIRLFLDAYGTLRKDLYYKFEDSTAIYRIIDDYSMYDQTVFVADYITEDGKVGTTAHLTFYNRKYKKVPESEWMTRVMKS